MVIKETMINKDIITSIQKDKLLHFFVGSCILFLSLLFFNTLISVSIVVIIAALKEIIYDDFLEKGTPEVEDFIYTIVPCLMHIINCYV
jgi:type IV secretory pathway TrbL component